LALLISGCPHIDVGDWKKHTRLEPCRSDREAHARRVAEWFWQLVWEMNQEQRARLLAFATGAARVPLAGFGQDGFVIGFLVDARKLPEAHTCNREIDLPLVASKEDLKRGLMVIVEMDNAGFGVL